MTVIQMKQAQPRKQRFRLRFLIFPQFQLVLIGANVLIMLVVYGVTWLQMSHSLSDLDVLAGLSGPQKDYFEKYLAYQSSQMHFAFFLSLVLGVVLSAGLTLVISHRFSGPLVRLRNYFKSIPGGAHPVPKLSFRRGDFLGDLPPLVNEAIRNIEDRNYTDPQRKAN